MPPLRRILRLLGLLSTLCLCYASAQTQAAPSEPSNAKPQYAPVQSMSEAQFAEQAKSAKRYTFELASPDGLVDETGAYISVPFLLPYLSEKHLDKEAYFILLITKDSPDLKQIAPTIDPIGRYGVTQIAVQHKKGREPLAINSKFKPAPGTPPDPKKHITLIKGKADAHSLSAGQPFPNLNKRPEALRPEALPPRVRYKFASDKAMMDAAELITARLLHTPATGTPQLFPTEVIIPYSAWTELQKEAGLGKTNTQPWNQIMETANGKMQFAGRCIEDREELTLLENKLRSMIAADGGALVRALKTSEMAQLWPFISFDFIEPTLVVETANQAHIFVFGMSDKGLVSIEDLRGLPKLQRKPQPAP